MTVELFEQVAEVELRETENLIEVLESSTELIEVIEGGAQGKPGPTGAQGDKGDRGHTGDAGPTGLDGLDHQVYTVEMNGTQSNYTAYHNLGRLVLVARIATPSGDIAEVSVRNLGDDGNTSLNIAQVQSSMPMLGTLTLI